MALGLGSYTVILGYRIKEQHPVEPPVNTPMMPVVKKQAEESAVIGMLNSSSKIGASLSVIGPLLVTGFMNGEIRE